MGKVINTAGLPDIAGPGIMVTDESGRIGITTDWVRKSGPSKGQLCVMWEGMGYEVAEWPEDISRFRA